METKGGEHRLIDNILRFMEQIDRSALDVHIPEDRVRLSELRGGIDPSEMQAVCDLVQFMDDMPGGFLLYYAWDDERIIYANKALLRIFGCESSQEFRTLTNNSFKGVVHPDDLDEVEESIYRQIAENAHNLDYVEYRITRKDGAVRWIEDYGHFVRNELWGDFFYVFLADATEKRDNRELERSALVNESLEKDRQMQDIIQSYDRERALIDREYLRRLEVIKGLSINYESILYIDLNTDEVLPYRLSVRTAPMFGELFRVRAYRAYAAEYAQRWVHQDERDMVARMTSPEYLRARLNETMSFYLNYRVLVGEETQYIQMRMVDVGRERGEKCSQVVVGYRRVDEEVQREMEQKQILAQALSSANTAMVAKNTFLSNMSHDMRTPLNAIFGFTILARQQAENDPTLLEYLDHVDNAGKQLLDLIDKVLELAQAGSSDVHTIEVECDMRELAQEIHKYFLAQAEEKNISFTLDTESLTNLSVYGDPERLHQLMLYLVNNAITYTNDGGHVSMRIRQGPMQQNGFAEYTICVEDTGIGISREFLDRIFEPFAREKNTTLSGVHGVGLGLTIVKNIVELMHGKIDVQSAPGVGSTFTVTLLLRVKPGETVHADTHEELPVDAPHRNILLVEDNRLNREIERELLLEEGFSVDMAEDGSVAVEKVRQSAPGQYDVILMDIQMPVMNGWQAASAIRRLDDPHLANIPIIALSANAFEEDRRKSTECGMNGHLKKPMDVSTVVAQIESVLTQ